VQNYNIIFYRQNYLTTFNHFPTFSAVFDRKRRKKFNVQKTCHKKICIFTFTFSDNSQKNNYLCGLENNQ